MDKIERMKELIPVLQKAGKAYYQEDREIMSNFEYDKLYDELETLERETGITLACREPYGIRGIRSVGGTAQGSP